MVHPAQRGREAYSLKICKMNATPYFKFHSRAIIFTTCAAAAAATAADGDDGDDGDDDKWQCETLPAARRSVERGRGRRPVNSNAYI